MEIDETFLVRRKYDLGRVLVQTWLFGGTEWETKKIFLVPLTEDVGIRRNCESLLPLIKKYIKPGSVIYSDGWRAYAKLGEEGFVHGIINHSEYFVDPENSHLHTQNTERLWRDVKEWVRKPGIRAKYLKKYLSRYLFLRQYKDSALHEFFIQAARLYPPHSDPRSHQAQETRTRAPVPAVEEDNNDGSDDPEFDIDL